MTRRQRPDFHPVARRWLLCGHVQGVGLRPAVVRWAQACQVAGHVRNASAGVEIHAEGSPAAVEAFAQGLRSHLPVEASLWQLECEPTSPLCAGTFVIAPAAADGDLAAAVPVDVATCNRCLDELPDPDNSRFGYGLLSCAQCGPRYSIVEAMPYDRERTSLRHFPLCPSCLHEYECPSDRRFHAESIACPVCGPRYWLAEQTGAVVARDAGALVAAVTRLAEGQIVALRGIGGYQLLVDAASDRAVRRLRVRKRRPTKPLAVMIASIEEVRRVAHVDAREQCALESRVNPIVVLRAERGTVIAPSVSGHLGTLGVMLPTSGLHAQLLRAIRRPLVVTSGNLEGEPLCASAEEATLRLRDVADVWLHHDRAIVNPIDDSVVRVMAGRVTTLRLGRGLAPLPLEGMTPGPVLALGGHQKMAVALSNTRQTVLGPHLGELATVPCREHYHRVLASLTRLYRCDPEHVAHDLHPDFYSTLLAERDFASRIAVQHHHAHIVSGMIEAGWLDRDVLGVAFDGAGYGPDGTLWGGEILHCSVHRFERLAHLMPFRLPGGEQPVHEPWRTAVAAVVLAAGVDAASRLHWDGIEPKRVAMMARIAGSPQLGHLTTSAGRLFDAVAALGMGLGAADFEGHSAMLWECEADPDERGAYEFAEVNTSPTQIDWRPMVRQVLADVARGTPAAVMSTRFHRGLAAAIFRVCQRYGGLPVVLSGGVFQNRLLVEALRRRFLSVRQPLALPGRIPPNDGGLAAGQLAVALARVRTA